ncbi:MAG: 50S ribosomal protein L19 [Opitutaceae bacterium]|nr:50S ribosomal protein L19 [Opitutaceae bacterium]|tara:strand:- start:3960 stop:4325 length:366 start_codon:yes stop_codon:yes gene_type:complete
MNPVIDEITKVAIRTDLTEFKVGDGVRVHIKIQEAGKERVQVFAGIVIARKGTGVHETFTVRRISFGEGVEKVFPVHSPIIEKIEVDRESITRRARLYYIRDRVGKEATKVKERRLSEGKR